MLCRYFGECALGPGEPSPDVFLLGFQETVELSPQNIVMGATNPACNARTGHLVVACEKAINALFGAKKIPNGDFGARMSGLAKGLGWKQRAAAKALDTALAARSSQHFATVAMERLVGLVSLLIVRTSSLFGTSSKHVARVKSRILPLGKKISGVTMGNKGACCFSLLLFGNTSVSFVTCVARWEGTGSRSRASHASLVSPLRCNALRATGSLLLTPLAPVLSLTNARARADAVLPVHPLLSSAARTLQRAERK